MILKPLKICTGKETQHCWTYCGSGNNPLMANGIVLSGSFDVFWFSLETRYALRYALQEARSPSTLFIVVYLSLWINDCIEVRDFWMVNVFVYILPIFGSYFVVVAFRFFVSFEGFKEDCVSTGRVTQRDWKCGRTKVITPPPSPPPLKVW